MCDNGIIQLEACRARLYAMAGLDMERDEAPPSSTEWKKRCQNYILPPVCNKCIRNISKLIFSLFQLNSSDVRTCPRLKEKTFSIRPRSQQRYGSLVWLSWTYLRNTS